MPKRSNRKPLAALATAARNGATQYFASRAPKQQGASFGSTCSKQPAVSIMLRETAMHSPRRPKLADAPGAVQLCVIECSDEDTSMVSASEEQAFLEKPSARSEDLDDDKVSKPKRPSPPAAKTKVLFLDGARGLAAMSVVVQHSGEFWPDLHLGSVGVDVFFVLSSFLLTWILMVKFMKLISQGASYRTWFYALADYFQKRFFRVYPLFFVTVMALSMMTSDDRARYFIARNKFDIFKTLTFDFDYRYHVLWTLPLEIAYYFVIPAFVLAALGMRRFWWAGAIPLTTWAVYEGVFVFRTSHMPMRPHITTFLTGSLAAVVFVKLDLWIKATDFKFRWWHTLFLRATEALAIAMLFSVCFRGLLFNWVHANPAPPPAGFPYTSAFLAPIMVIEMIQPSFVSTTLEWNVLRFWGKISFSIYMLHTFIIQNHTVDSQRYYFDRFFARLILVQALATTGYIVIEYPSQLLAQRISRFLVEQEKKGPHGSVGFMALEQIDNIRKRIAGKMLS
ncbi:unnamed protein product [Phytophthora lilii]|uniref:Unnamed protein product n=1 Tax=Phytophthora lilii TaxID=2077276 RepID=A0A9W7CJ84_9STRA|nr:unnamed protein product [Phytophthora lilii]